MILKFPEEFSSSYLIIETDTTRKSHFLSCAVNSNNLLQHFISGKQTNFLDISLLRHLNSVISTTYKQK